MKRVVVLAKSIGEATVYARRLGLPSSRYFCPGSAQALVGISNVEVHVLPGFGHRRDRHAMWSEVKRGQRRGRLEIVDVEMPEKVEVPAVDQGDGMGEQLDLLEAAIEADLEAEKVAVDPQVAMLAAQRVAKTEERAKPLRPRQKFFED